MHFICHLYTTWYRDGVGNTTEENSSIFSLIWMLYLPSAKGMRAVKLCSDKIIESLTGDAG